MSQNYTFGSIIPLIGGMTIAAKQALGKNPDFIASWPSAFAFNDSYCLKYFENDNIPYYDLDKGDLPAHHVDIITSLPPCAGLSTSNTSKTGKNPHGCNAPSNVHMLRGCEQAMKYSEPRCIIVENAPTLFTAVGAPFADRIVNLANQYGYTMSMVKTSTAFHGLPQDRPRTFYFLWKGSKAPILHTIRKPYNKFHEFLRDNEFVKSDLVSKAPPPSADPYWQFVQYKNPSLSKQQILEKYAGKTTISVWNVIWKNGWLDEAIDWIDPEAHPRKHRWLKYAKMKKARGLGVMDASIKLSWEKARSLMWQTLPHTMHPYEDRWLSVSEALALMGFPQDFQLRAPISEKDHNVIAQNCPVCTAADWIEEIVESLNGNREWIDIPPGQILRQSNVTINKTMKPIIS